MIAARSGCHPGHDEFPNAIVHSSDEWLRISLPPVDGSDLATHGDGSVVRRSLRAMCLMNRSAATQWAKYGNKILPRVRRSLRS